MSDLNTVHNPLFESIIWLIQGVKDLDSDKVADLIIHAPQYYSEWWSNLLQEAPLHLIIETSLCLFIVWLVFIRKTVDPTKSSKKDKLSDKEVEWLLDTWQPEPLVPELSEKEKKLADGMLVIDSMQGNYLTIRGVKEPVLNIASFDFLGLSLDDNVKKTAREALDFYGCGSCGPRGFYGTIDQHVFFEKAIAKFMGAQEAISYSDGASAVSSAIPAFAKKGDLLLVDAACCEPIMTGLNLSRSTVQFFRHNDMDHLREILQSISDDDKRLKRDTTQQRRFIVVEGLYRNTGDICPLPEILELKEQYCYRLILDESLSFGSIGQTGRGVTEYYGLKTADVEITTLAMDTTLASVGGVCIGSREIVDHQRLSGAGYCFSASAPPFLSACAIEALKRLEREPQLLEDLHSKMRLLHRELQQLKGMKLRSPLPTPVLHLQLSQPMKDLEEEAMLVMKLARDCIERGVGVTASKYSIAHPTQTQRPSLMLCVTTKLTEAEMKKISAVLQVVINLNLQN